jgi:hypothetical protein
LDRILQQLTLGTVSHTQSATQLTTQSFNTYSNRHNRGSPFDFSRRCNAKSHSVIGPLYRLSKRNPIYHQIVKLLWDAIAKKRALQIRCTSPEGNAIVEVRN